MFQYFVGEEEINFYDHDSILGFFRSVLSLPLVVLRSEEK